MNSTLPENRTTRDLGVNEALFSLVVRCMQNLNRGALTPQPFAGYWIDPKLFLPDAEKTVLLFDPIAQDIWLGSLDTDEFGNEIWIDLYGRELENISLWAELPYPDNQSALSTR